MTFAELALLLMIGTALYFAMRPLRRRLEFHLYRFFRGKRKGPGPVIDIFDSRKKTDRK